MSEASAKPTGLTPVVKRTLWLLLFAGLFAWLAVATGLPERGGRGVAGGEAHDGAGHAATEQAGASGAVGHDASAHAAGHATVASEAEFIAAMVPHHQEAVSSATALLAISERPEIRALTEDVIRAQTAEIERLQGWLADVYPQEPAYQGYVPMMRPTLGMSVEQAEVAFMEDMILHHGMAVAMAEAYLALEAPRRAEVEALARDVVGSQSQEIETMRAWLAEQREGGHDGH